MTAKSPADRVASVASVAARARSIARELGLSTEDPPFPQYDRSTDLDVGLPASVADEDARLDSGSGDSNGWTPGEPEQDDDLTVLRSHRSDRLSDETTQHDAADPSGTRSSSWRSGRVLVGAAIAAILLIAGAGAAISMASSSSAGGSVSERPAEARDEGESTAEPSTEVALAAADPGAAADLPIPAATGGAAGPQDAGLPPLGGGTQESGGSAPGLTPGPSSGPGSATSNAPVVAPVIPVAAPRVTTSSVGTAAVGSAYSLTFSASGGTQPYRWSVAGGSLPPGLSLQPDGSLGGTPISPATSTFSIRVTDTTGLSDVRQYSLSPIPRRGDVNRDGVVDCGDVDAVEAAWNQRGDRPEDVNGDGVVDLYDMSIVLSNVQASSRSC